MIFSSIEFLFFFLPLFFIIYFSVPFKAKNIILLVFSLLFYAWGEPVYILLLIFSSVVDYTNGRLIDRFWNRQGIKKFFMLTSVVINLALLIVFKYTSFIIESINCVFNLAITDPSLKLPIGISFFTFQTMSYSIDVYRGDIKAERSFLTFMTYVCMFPQLIAGPVIRYSSVGKQLHKRSHTLDGFCIGGKRFLTGLFKKTLIADNLGLLWSIIKSGSYGEISLMTAWLGIIAFTLQIYYDFSGYADMAIGMGKMMGFDYCENFNYPLFSKSVTDFWRRWHISLSTWFRDYVYIPLGGNRCGAARHIFNICLVWGLTGLWHGASLNFLLWGLYYAVLLVCEKYFWGKALERLPNFIGHIYAVFIIVVGFCIFDLDSLSSISDYFKAMFFAGNNPFADRQFLYYLYNYRVVLAVAFIFAMPVYKQWECIRQNKPLLIFFESAVTFVLFFAAVGYMAAGAYSPFLYFRF